MSGHSTPTSRTTLLSVVSPVYGCSQCLETLVERIDAAVLDIAESHEIILVDDGSPDDAWRRISELAQRNPHLRGIKFARNFGQHQAIFAGLEHARGTHVVVMDCDMQDVPDEIPSLYFALSGEYEAVIARRSLRQDGVWKRLGSFLFYRLLSWLTGVRQDHRTANFGIFSRKVVDALVRMPESERFFPLMVKWTGLPVTQIEVAHAPRPNGRSSYSLKRLIRLGASVVMSYSDKPLKLVVQAGLCFSLLAFSFAGVSVWRYFEGDIAVAGFTSIIASIWLLGGTMTFSIGIVGLYVGRIFTEVKGRPRHVIDKVVGGTEGGAGVD